MIQKKYQWLIFILISLSFSRCKSEKPDLTFAEYNEYYHFDFPNASHRMEIIPLADYQIAVHYFEPADSMGSIMVVHGYYDHAAIAKRIIAYLLNHQYTVIASDLPGHGLSSGARADIDDFAEYTAVQKELNNIITEKFNPPFHLIGHSTGAAIIIDGLLNLAFENMGKIILVSPLIHTDKWELAITGHFAADIFLDSVPRVFRKNSSDRVYTNFVKTKDMLQNKTAPLNWFQSLIDWNKIIAPLEISDREVLVIQGDKDSIVDWQYNLNFIESKFPKSKTQMIDGGNHQLFNETEKIREQVFDTILTYLEK